MPWLVAPILSFVFTPASPLKSASPTSIIKTPWSQQNHLGDPSELHLKIFNLVTCAKSLLPYKAAVTDSRNKDVDLLGGGEGLLNQPQSLFFFLLAHMISSPVTVTWCCRCRMKRTSNATHIYDTLTMHQLLSKKAWRNEQAFFVPKGESLSHSKDRLVPSWSSYTSQ